MQKSTAKINNPSQVDKATIIFMRENMKDPLFGVELFEIVDDQLEYIGTVGQGEKIAHYTTAGKKLYMAYGQAADFMVANVEEGKVYLSVLVSNYWTGGWAPTPIKLDGTTKYHTDRKDYRRWQHGATLMTKKSLEAESYFQQNKAKFEAIYKDYWASGVKTVNTWNCFYPLGGVSG